MGRCQVQLNLSALPKSPCPRLLCCSGPQSFCSCTLALVSCHLLSVGSVATYCSPHEKQLFTFRRLLCFMWEETTGEWPGVRCLFTLLSVVMAASSNACSFELTAPILAKVWQKPTVSVNNHVHVIAVGWNSFSFWLWSVEFDHSASVSAPVRGSGVLRHKSLSSLM